MALQSQAPRSSGPRRYTSTGRRKKGLAPWLILLALVVIVAGLIVLFSDPADPASPANANADDGAAEPATTGSGDPGLLAINPPTQNGSTTSGQVTPPDRDTAGTSAERTGSNDPTRTDPRLEAIARDGSGVLLEEASEQIINGVELLDEGNIAEGRKHLSELLFRDGALPRHEAHAIRVRLSALNEKTIFSKSLTNEQVRKDPILTLHTVQSGEYLSTIGNTYRLPYQLIERINVIEARRLQAGKDLQVIRGPIHARIDKSDYRMDLYVEDPDGLRIYLKSYTVGLGEFDSTPIGKWIVKPGSKVGPANGGPSWVNPRTGKRYDRNDPDIPIGEYWMALEGIDDNTRDKKGYGIHATNDPESIGRQESMGCIRMRDEDVDEVFYTLFEGASIVEIVP
jgi:lipoprotein-anchoring transpeptidase ErfK/SrfK